jgi:hypothetical protein
MRLVQGNRIPFVECGSDVPVIKFTLDDGTIGYGVVDTGSESTVFDKDFVKANKQSFKVEITSNKMGVVGVSDKMDVPIVKVCGPLYFKDVRCTVNAVMMPLTHLTSHFENIGVKLTISALFGSDMLKYLNAGIDFKKKMVMFK